MDIFNAILGALPTLGPIGIVLLILAYVGKQWVSSDARYRAEIERLNKAHDDELSELRNDIHQLREDIRALRKELDDERRLRYEAQEEAHRARLAARNEKSE